MQVCVDAQIVGQVISGWTGIPLGKMIKMKLERFSRSIVTWVAV